MNRHERAKAEALARCRIADTRDRAFARGMVMLARRDAATVLSPRQKWTLDRLVYRYRRQIYRDDQVLVPEHEPRLEDYQLNARPRRQLDLFGVRPS